MAQDPDEKKHFTVKDRRRINLDSEESEEPAFAETPVSPASPEPPLPSPPSRLASDVLPKVDFIGFVASLAAQAGALLSDQEHPEEGEAAAREIIAILEMLQDKTEGRRTPRETEVLEAMLYELRMVFVQRDGHSQP